MRTISLVLVLTVLFFSCKKDENRLDTLRSDNGFIGEWKLTAVSFDIGNGQGAFKSVKSDKTIEFHPDGTLTSNGSIYNITSIESNSPSNGTYSLIDSTIYASDFPINSFPNRFKKEGGTLVIYFGGCIEPCKAKFLKN